MKRFLMFLVISMSSFYVSVVSAQKSEVKHRVVSPGEARKPRLTDHEMRKILYLFPQFILKKDFITPEEVMKAYPKVVYTENQMMTLSMILPSLDDLRWFKENGYAIMPSPPREMSMLEMRRINTFTRKEAEWYSHQSFYSEDKTTFGWLAIRKTTIPNSINKSWKGQCEFLSTRESVPNVPTMSWFIATYFKVRNVRLFYSTRSRTSSVDSDGNRVIIGGLAEGIYVNNWYDNAPSDDVGVSSSVQ